MSRSAGPARVLHLLPDLAHGGGQSVVQRSLAALDRQRFTPMVATLAPPDDLLAQFESADVPVFRLAEAGRDAASALRRLMKTERVDVLHVHSDVDRKVGMRAALWTGTPVVVHLHSMWVHLADDPNSRPGRLYARRLLERRVVRHYVAASSAVQRAYAPYVRAPMSVLPAPVDTECFRPADDLTRQAARRSLGITAATPLVMSVARFAEGKGQGDVIEAFAKARAAVPATQLVMVGDGPERTAIEARAVMLGVANDVRFLGQRSDIAELLRAADVFAFGSHSESFGVAVLEALSCGLPVVAYDLPCFADFVPVGAAQLVPLGDVDALGVALADLVSDRATMQRMGAVARAGVIDHAPDSAAEVLEVVYDAVLGHERIAVA